VPGACYGVAAEDMSVVFFRDTDSASAVAPAGLDGDAVDRAAAFSASSRRHLAPTGYVPVCK
jgi:hypothetical protein